MSIHDVLAAYGYNGHFPDASAIANEDVADQVKQCKILIMYVHDETADDSRCKIEWSTAINLKMPILCIGDASRCKVDEIQKQLGQHYPNLLRVTWMTYIDVHRQLLFRKMCDWFTANAQVRSTLAGYLPLKQLPVGKSYHYFLSHKKKHSSLGFQPEAMARAFHDVLQCRGFQGFFDVDNLEQISADDVEKGVKSSCAVIIFLHNETCESEWCKFEWKVAAENDIPVLCVVDTANFKKQDLLAQVTSTCPQLLEYQWLEMLDGYRHAIQERTWMWLDRRIEQRFTALSLQLPGQAEP